MRDAESPVVFQPMGRTVHVLRGTRLLEAAAGAGLAFDTPCGGEGTCGKCRVVVRQGAGEPVDAERRVFSARELTEGFRLACQTTVEGPMTVEVPPTSLLATQYQILARTEAEAVAAVDPPLRKTFVELPAPDRSDDAADLARLRRAIGPVEPDLDLLRGLPGLLRPQAFRGTAVVADGRLIDFEPGDTRALSFAVAVDVGTTTLVAVLVDLTTGADRAVASRLNPQTGFGDDVLSRILHAQQPGGLEDLRQAVVRAIDEMLGELAAQAGIGREQIYEVVFSGNTTMQELLCGIDPRFLGEVPFVPATSDPVRAAAAELGFHIHPRGRAYVLPVIGGFVGGDTVAGILATRLDQSPGPALLIDIGTNGEIVLWANGRLAAASTAAGPAFEGARIAQGMRASAGAIEKVVVRDGGLHINVIGDVPPVGLCGSALIDAAAEFLRHGLMTSDGRLVPPAGLPQALSPELRRRVIAQDGKTAVVLAWDADSGNGRAVTLSQRDVRELQLASGAIRAGTAILLQRAGLRPADLEAVLLAGGFGNFIRRSNAQRIGLLPGEIPRHRIRYQGNTSLAGARLVAVSENARRTAEELARRTEHVDLSRDADFRWSFAESMIFP